MMAATFFTDAQDGNKGARNKGGYTVKKSVQTIKK